MESYISHPDFGKSNFELFKTIKQETNNFQIDELLYLKNDLGNSLNDYLSSHSQTRTSSDGSIITDFSREINLIENKLQIIDDELSRLEREKAKGNPKGGRNKKNGEIGNLALNNIDDTLSEIIKILEQMNECLFENSKENQWKQFLKGEKVTEPIILKKGITHRDIKYFLDEMERNGIWKANYTIIENIGAFWYRGKVLTQKQISNANGMKANGEEKYIIEHKNKNKIDAITSLLSLLD